MRSFSPLTTVWIFLSFFFIVICAGEVEVDEDLKVDHMAEVGTTDVVEETVETHDQVVQQPGMVVQTQLTHQRAS